MTGLAGFVCASVLLGAGATLVMDIWALVRARVFGIAGLDYALVGRWAGHMVRGRFAHARIAAAPPVPGERALGWTFHYATGIGFAAILLAVWGLDWLSAPTLLPALIVGLGSAAAPFLIMQPAFGMGIAASRTPSPLTARRRTLITHTVFAAGLYLAAWPAGWLLAG